MSFIKLFNGDGFEYLAKIQEILHHKIQLKLIEKQSINCNDNELKITLAVCLIKNDPMKWLVQKAVELGASEVIPIISERVNLASHNQDNKVKKQQRFRQIAIHAAEQSRADKLAEFREIISFNELMNKSHQYPNKLILSTKTQNTNFEQFTKKNVLILIGPEGDFTEAEYNRAKENQFIDLSLGKRILRAETATISVLSIFNFLNK